MVLHPDRPEETLAALRVVQNNIAARKIVDSLGQLDPGGERGEYAAGCVPTSLVALFGAESVLPSELNDFNHPLMAVLRMMFEARQNGFVVRIPTSATSFVYLLSGDEARGALLLQMPDQGHAGHALAVVPLWKSGFSGSGWDLERKWMLVNTNDGEDLIKSVGEEELVDLYAWASMAEVEPGFAVGRYAIVLTEEYDEVGSPIWDEEATQGIVRLLTVEQLKLQKEAEIYAEDNAFCDA